LELNAGDRESCIGGQDEQRRRSEGLSRSVRVFLGMRSMGKSILDWSLTLEKCILLRGQLRCLRARYCRKAVCRRVSSDSEWMASRHHDLGSRLMVFK
jgi:hypothetical protein